MSPPPDPRAKARQILVIANETCASSGMVEEVRYRAAPDAEVLVVAPALARGRLEHWLSSDAEGRRARALARLQASIRAFSEAGLSARGHLGDADPLQALDDALRVYEPDEIVISTHPPQRSNWLERQVVRRARERYTLPITHVVVDLEHESAVAEGDVRPRSGAGPRRTMRVFHASDYDEAMEVRRAGFRDAPAAGGRAGVWVTDRPPAGAGSDAILFQVELPEEVLAGYEETAGEDAGERRFLLPAELLNRHGPPVADGEWSE